MRRTWLLTAVALVCFASALAQPVTMQLTAPVIGSSAPTLAGVYINPYTALIGAAGQTATAPALITGTPTQVICDDFTTDITTDSPAWQANAMSVAQLLTLDQTALAANSNALGSSLVKFDSNLSALQQEQDYVAAAYLANQIFAAQTMGQTTLQGDLSFALWGIFDPTSIDANGPLSGNWITGADLTAAQAELANAVAYASVTANLNPASWGNVILYTPNPPTASQEFDAFAVTSGGVVSAPEPSAPSLLAVYLSSLVGLIFLFRRRVVRSAS